MTIKTPPFEEIHIVDANYPIRIHKCEKYFGFPAHYHKEVEVVFVAKGQLVIQVNQSTYTLCAGDLLIIGGHHIHTYIKDSKLEMPTYYMLIFDWNYLDDLNKHMTRLPYLAPLFLDTHYIASIDNKDLYNAFSRLHQEYKHPTIGREIMIVSQLYYIIATCAKSLDMTHTTPVDLKRLQKTHSLIYAVNTLIYNHYMEDITLDLVAENAGYSTYHFTRIFKKETGFTFKEYLNNFRIHKAVEYLSNPSLSMTDIALSCGFGSIKSFNRNFKAIKGMTPSQYKKANFVYY